MFSSCEENPFWAFLSPGLIGEKEYIKISVSLLCCRVPIIFRGRTSHDEIMTKLSKRKIKWASDHVVKHEKSTKSVAALSKATQRRIQQLVNI